MPQKGYGLKGQKNKQTKQKNIFEDREGAVCLTWQQASKRFLPPLSYLARQQRKLLSPAQGDDRYEPVAQLVRSVRIIFTLEKKLHRKRQPPAKLRPVQIKSPRACKRSRPDYFPADGTYPAQNNYPFLPPEHLTAVRAWCKQ